MPAAVTHLVPAPDPDTPNRRPSTHRGTISYLAPLDGLRAVAVGSVIAFHFGAAWLPGGFLGVDIFFVISGYLITSLLLAEVDEHRNIALGTFWGRRARRLFPALFVTLLGASLCSRFLGPPDLLDQVRGDAFSALFYFANWHFIASSQGYFGHFGPTSPLLHTWSLAVEEQFYIVWPLIFVAIYFLARHRSRNTLLDGRRFLLAVAGTGALASAVTMALAYRSAADNSRLYYGTDTHAQVILVGALLAVVAPSIPAARSVWRYLIYVAGCAGVVVLGWSMHSITGASRLLYQGGFALIAVSAAAVIVHIRCLPRSPIGRALSLGPARYIGRISYGLYLYHWPIFIYVDAQRTGLTGLPLAGARSVATLAIASASYHFLEQPIRHGFSGKLSGRLQIAAVLPVTVAVVAATIVVSTSVSSTPAFATNTTTTAPTWTDGHPVIVDIEGDSVALTFAIGLANPASNYGIVIENNGQLGCGITTGNPVRVSGAEQTLPPSCDRWEQTWKENIDAAHPDVVGILIGRWEVVDRYFEGHWTDITNPQYATYVREQLETAVATAQSGGARVVFFTTPFFDDGEDPSGHPWPESDPHRVEVLNGLISSVAQSHPDTVSVIDLNRMLDPGGHFSAVVDGEPARWSDGVHICYQGGELVAPLVLPGLRYLGVSAYEHAGARTSLSPVSPQTIRTPGTSPDDLRSQVQDRSPVCTGPTGAS